MTPYRSARIEGRIADPSRPRFGLAGAAAGAVACFAALMDLHFAQFTAVDSVLLFGGSAAIAILVAYAALDAPAGRVATLAAALVFALSFVPQLAIRAWMGEYVFGVRYLGLAGIAGGLLLRLRRTRPGTHGVLLRVAGLIALWWGVQSLVALVWTHAHQTLRAELLSRSLYLVLAAGMLDMRRFVGAVPLHEPVRTPMHTAREIATTRIVLALVSTGALLAALPYAWHSEWNVIAAAEGVAIAITLAFHIPWLAREHMIGHAAGAGLIAFTGLLLVVGAYDARALAPAAALSCMAAAITTDVAVARCERSARGAKALALLAAAIHAANGVGAALHFNGP